MGGNLGIGNVKHKGSLSAVEATSAAKFNKSGVRLGADWPNMELLQLPLGQHLSLA